MNENYCAEDKWNLRFLFLAKHVATWSKDPSTKVGSVIFDTDHRVVSLGYNGLPSGLNDDHVQDRERKYKTIIHAEINAILSAKRDLKNCTIATWPFMPCSNCSSAIIQSGIKTCIFPKAYGDRAVRWADSFLLAKEQFEEAGLSLREYDVPELLDCHEDQKIFLSPQLISTFVEKKKDLVLCAAINLTVEQIEIFFKSFRKFNKDAEVFCLVESGLSEAKKNFIESYDVNLLYFDSIRLLNTQYNNSRYLKFSDFIKENFQNYKNVLLTDVRDVVFQKDPFFGLTGEFLIGPEEDDQFTIEMDQQFNARWVKQCYGDYIYRELNQKNIICCGTVIGSMKNIRIYLDYMKREMLRIYEQRNQFFDDMMDTAIHVFLFYKKPDIFENLIVKKNGDYIATVGLTVINYPHKIKYEENQISVNGLIPAIVHQYDRSNELINFFYNIYR